jgi:hypothetical protein
MYKFDIRSMINYIQYNLDIFSNKNIINNNILFDNNKLYNKLHNMIKEKIDINEIYDYIYFLSSQYNIDLKTIIKNF